MIDGIRHIYFIGIGGSGMSGLARITHAMGFTVSGSDLRDNGVVRSLRASGIEVQVGQEQVGFSKPDLVVYSTAIGRAHLEFRAAQERKIPLVHRADLLSVLFSRAATSIAVTGTHGKTTTSALVSFLLARVGARPTCFVGSDMVNFDSNIIFGENKFWVAEVDESDRSHELFRPHYGILTNLEMDHHDHYQGIADLEASFSRFLTQFQNPGLAVYCRDDERLHALVSASGKPALGYGFHPEADLSARNIKLESFGSCFDVYEGAFYLGEARLSVPGRHNILNALGAIGVMLHMGFSWDDIAEPLAGFKGTKRRMEVKWHDRQLTVVDDYAHHPTEVKAVIDALAEQGHQIFAVFQPHRYSRTRSLYREFAASLEGAQKVFVTDIYAAGEAKLPEVSSDLIVEEAKKLGRKEFMVIQKEKIIELLSQNSYENHVVAFLGAGDIGEVADEFVSHIRTTHS